jgi:hypothetical protein
MPRLVCWSLYVECHVLAVASLQSDQLYVYLSTSFSMLYYMLAHECQISVVGCQVCLYVSCSMSTVYAGTWVPSSSLWVVKLAYMSNYYISVYMPSALFQELYAKCYGLYAKLHMLDYNMPNAMTIAMSFRMTTEQVGYFVIYIYIYLSSGYDSPYCRYREEITIIPPGLQFISQGLRYFSMPAYHGKEQNVSMPTYVIFCIPASVSYILASISQVSGLRYISLLAYQVTKWYLESQVFSVCRYILAWAKFQCAGISWQE